MGSVGGQIALDAQPERVWAFITDPDNFGAYVDGYVEGRATTANPTGIGARYEWVGRAGPLRLESVEEVVDWQEGRRVAYRGTTAGVSFDSSMEVEPDGSDRTSLRVAISYRLPPRLGGRAIDALLVRRLVRSHVLRSLDRLARALR